jgi:NTE family protein
MGDYFRKWIDDLIKEKTGKSNTTFKQMQELAGRKEGFRELHLMVTNLSTGFSEVMSAETSPDDCIADAVRFSMSIPFFFAAKRSKRGDVYTDGGVLDNYPVKIFDRSKYLDTKTGGVVTDYYKAENKRFIKEHPEGSPYIYNKETLGFRLDSKEEIALFRDRSEPVHHKIDKFSDYLFAVICSYINSQDNQHLHSDDWQRTIYIDTLGVGFADFSIKKETKDALVKSGRKGVREYFKWYDAEDTQAANK